MAKADARPSTPPLSERHRHILAALWRLSDRLGRTVLSNPELRQALEESGLFPADLTARQWHGKAEAAKMPLRIRGLIVVDSYHHTVELVGPRPYQMPKPDRLFLAEARSSKGEVELGALVSPRSTLRGLTLRQRAALAELPAMLRQRIEGARA